MKLLNCLLISIALIPILCTAQKNIPYITDDLYYKIAYTEIVDMLEGRKAIDFKRAVFLPEWAYLRGKLDYDKYCEEIAVTVKEINNFIVINNLSKYRTAGNAALFEFFCQPYSMNGYKPYTYDFEDFTGEEDFTKVFVTKLMRTHTGQCRSLPMFYKVLAEELGVEACISFAPQHVFIRHRDEYGKWVNLELTNHGISKDEFYISNFGINASTIRNNIYLSPLSTKETLAYLLTEMVCGYERICDNDSFHLLCANKSLEHYPINVLGMCIKDKVLRTRGMAYQDTYGVDETATAIHLAWKENREKLEGLGYETMEDKTYQRLLDATKNKHIRKTNSGQNSPQLNN